MARAEEVDEFCNYLRLGNAIYKLFKKHARGELREDDDTRVFPDSLASAVDLPMGLDQQSIVRLAMTVVRYREQLSVREAMEMSFSQLRQSLLEGGASRRLAIASDRPETIPVQQYICRYLSTELQVSNLEMCRELRVEDDTDEVVYAKLIEHAGEILSLVPRDVAGMRLTLMQRAAIAHAAFGEPARRRVHAKLSAETLTPETASRLNNRPVVALDVHRGITNASSRGLHVMSYMPGCGKTVMALTAAVVSMCVPESVARVEARLQRPLADADGVFVSEPPSRVLRLAVCVVPPHMLEHWKSTARGLEGMVRDRFGTQLHVMAQLTHQGRKRTRDDLGGVLMHVETRVPPGEPVVWVLTRATYMDQITLRPDLGLFATIIDEDCDLMTHGRAMRRMSPCWATYIVNATPDSPHYATGRSSQANNHPLASALRRGCFCRAYDVDQEVAAHGNVCDTVTAMARARLMLPPPTIQCGMLMSAMTSMPGTVTLHPMRTPVPLYIGRRTPHYEALVTYETPVDAGLIVGVRTLYNDDGTRLLTEEAQVITERFREQLYAVPYNPSVLESRVRNCLRPHYTELHPNSFAGEVRAHACIRCAEPMDPAAGVFVTRCCGAMACMGCLERVCRCKDHTHHLRRRLEDGIARLGAGKTGLPFFNVDAAAVAVVKMARETKAAGRPCKIVLCTGCFDNVAHCVELVSRVYDGAAVDVVNFISGARNVKTTTMVGAGCSRFPLQQSLAHESGVNPNERRRMSPSIPPPTRASRS